MLLLCSSVVMSAEQNGEDSEEDNRDSDVGRFFGIAFMARYTFNFIKHSYSGAESYFCVVAINFLSNC